MTSPERATWSEDVGEDDRSRGASIYSVTCTPTSSIRSNISLSKTAKPKLHDNLLRQQKRRDPHEFFDVIEVLGVGSMGSVAKVRKRDFAVGGSARSSFVDSYHSAKGLETCFELPLLGSLLKNCFGLGESHKPSLIMATPDPSVTSSAEEQQNRKTLTHKDSSEIYYALKSIHMDKLTAENAISEMRNEINILKTLDHPNIVRPIETFEYKNELFILMELCEGGDLYTRDPYTEGQAAAYVSSILNALAFMHSRNIMHRDLKYENIVFADKSNNSDIKIIDFGLSKFYITERQQQQDAVGTIYTMAPEVLKGDYTSKADLWSVGVIAFMLLSSSMPFYGKRRRVVVQKIMNCEYSLKSRVWRKISPDAKRFVWELLQRDPDRRPTAEEAMQTPWLSTQFDSSGGAPEIKQMDAVQATLQTFAEYGALKKLALLVVAHKSTSEEIGFLKKVFREFDKLKHGIITLPEFKESLEIYGYTDEEMELMFQGMDLDGTGCIHYTEFLAATIEAHGAISEERLAEAFDRIDSDDSGFISVQNLREFLGENVSKEYINEIIDEADLRHDHKITYDEFLAMWDPQVQESNRIHSLTYVKRRRMERSPAISRTSSLTGMSLSGGCLDVEEVMSEISFGGASDDEVYMHANFQAEKARSVRTPRVGNRAKLSEVAEKLIAEVEPPPVFE